MAQQLTAENGRLMIQNFLQIVGCSGSQPAPTMRAAGVYLGVPNCAERLSSLDVLMVQRSTTGNALLIVQSSELEEESQ